MWEQILDNENDSDTQENTQIEPALICSKIKQAFLPIYAMDFPIPAKNIRIRWIHIWEKILESNLFVIHVYLRIHSAVSLSNNSNTILSYPSRCSCLTSTGK